MVVDLRSDTFTKPTPEMRRAMAEAEVGDDVYGEDPTVNALEARAAAVAGKQAAIFVTTGTMANTLAIRVQTEAGDEALMHEAAHPFHHEAGGAAALWGVTIRPLPGARGLPDADALRAAIHGEVRHMSRPRLLCLEDTHNFAGGTVLPVDGIRELAGIAHEAGLSVHVDGARIFNASVASGVPVATIASEADTVCFCFSKGLGAPVGSVLCGPAASIERARRFRHMLGGGWRQAGVLAAAAAWALDHHVDRLADDHRRARALAAAIDGSGRATVLTPPETNIVVFEPHGGAAAAEAMERALAAKGVLVGGISATVLRAVTHLDVDDDGIGRAVEAFG